MPPYDGLGIGVERGAVVLDVGAAYTKYVMLNSHLLESHLDRRILI